VLIYEIRQLMRGFGFCLECVLDVLMPTRSEVVWSETPPPEYVSKAETKSDLSSWSEADVDAIKAWFASMDSD
jgi:hypothetical protein